MNDFNIIKSEKHHIGRFDINMETVETKNCKYPYSWVDIQEGIAVFAVVNCRIMLLREYRIPLRQYMYEIPSGMLDAEETPEAGARRELLEETGYEADELTSLGVYYPSFGSTNEKINLFYAEVNMEPGQTSKEPLEDIEVELVTLDEFATMINNGMFCQASGLAAYARYMVKKQFKINA